MPHASFSLHFPTHGFSHTSTAARASHPVNLANVKPMRAELLHIFVVHAAKPALALCGCNGVPAG